MIDATTDQMAPELLAALDATNERMSPELLAALDATPGLLAAFESTHAPLRGRRQPYWRPTAPACSRDPWVPVLDWTRPDVDRTTLDTITLDVNGAWLAPLAGANLAHGALQHTGAGVDGRDPGYYLIPAHPWQGDHVIISPLGSAPLPRPTIRRGVPLVWVTAPTVELLQQLTESGHWHSVEIQDSWTCPDKVRPTAWANYVRDLRADRLGGDPYLYKALKIKYAQAIQMMAKGDNCKTQRPDWTHTMKALHAANCWRKTWRCAQAGYTVLRTTKDDELILPEAEVIHMRSVDKDHRPIKLDDSGVQIGAYKAKKRTAAVR